MRPHETDRARPAGRTRGAPPREEVRPAVSGALLVDKRPGLSSFGVIEELQKMAEARYGVRKRQLPKFGHGGTLDPFATGLLAVCVGRAVKLARYFLNSTKTYEGVILFGQTTTPGDPTSPVTETSDRTPDSVERLRESARLLTQHPYLQTPPMHSAKKRDGKPLYELARAGLEVEREPKLCHLYEFEIAEYAPPRARVRVVCSSGTYVRTLAQDFGRLLGTVAMLESLDRTATGCFRSAQAWTLERISGALASGAGFDELECWIPFDRLLDGYGRAEATHDEKLALFQGRQNVLFNILRRSTLSGPDASVVAGQESCIAIYHRDSLVAVARREKDVWNLERVFAPGGE